MSKIDVGVRVQDIRKSVALNLRDFAARLSTSAGRISEIESGKTMPGGDFLLRLHAEFAVDLNWLLTGSVADGSFAAPPALTPEETALIDNFRHSPPAARQALKTTSDLFAKHDCPGATAESA
jgi:transcriptional regulator with XRE-family HTH domain